MSEKKKLHKRHSNGIIKEKPKESKSELSDEQWEQIKGMFPRAKTGRPPKDNRVMMNAILWLARS